MKRTELVPRCLSWVEVDMQGGDAQGTQALRLLARWLVARARKGAPSEVDQPSAEPKNPVDIAPESKVVSKPE